VDAASLQRTVQRHNEFAATGIDEDFGRGTSAMNRFNGDPANTPNPCMRPIDTAPLLCRGSMAGRSGQQRRAEGVSTVAFWMKAVSQYRACLPAVLI
jgi:hypothetical protein